MLSQQSPPLVVVSAFEITKTAERLRDERNEVIDQQRRKAPTDALDAQRSKAPSSDGQDASTKCMPDARRRR